MEFKSCSRHMAAKVSKPLLNFAEAILQQLDVNQKIGYLA
jgi:hypothetical protein